MSVDVSTFIAIIGAGSTLLAALLSGLASGRKEISIRGEAQDSPMNAVDYRISDARMILRRQQRQAYLNKAANSLLVLGQFVVGGLLASSFAQQSLSKEVLGLLGLVVLASSILQQQFRPLLRGRSAAERAHLLRTLVRWAEDEVAPYRRGQSDSKDLWEIRKRISTEMSHIEALELDDVEKKAGGAVGKAQLGHDGS